MQKWVVNVPHTGDDCQAGPPPVAYHYPHLAHGPHSVYSNLCGMDHHFHTS